MHGIGDAHIVASQRPATQICPDGHDRPQAPQWVLDARRLLSHPLAAIPSQSARPVVHTRLQVPIVQVAVPPGPLGQLRPHIPQCAGSLARSTHIPPQRVCPMGQGRSVHAPATQVCPAAQATPHAPQCAVAVRVSVSQPLSMFPSQLPMPVMHAMPQEPATQVGVAPGAVGQTRPHIPQWFTSV